MHSETTTTPPCKIDAIRDRLNRAIKGKEEVIHYVLIALLAKGHLLLEDRPGLGKTTLAKALANAIGGSFARIQCTPDLLPGDITGFSIFNQRSHEFEFREGPVFTDVLLADEINRATPRTQSALLEAMAEHQVTVDSIRYPLSSKFFVIATQNPTDQHGTYPLPEAQLDRFAMKLSIGYPAPADEKRLLQDSILERQEPREEPSAIFTPEDLAEYQNRVAKIHVDAKIQDYMIALASKTREHPHVPLGVSPRGVLTWQRASQASAFLDGRDFVTPDDVQSTAFPVLSVRLGGGHRNVPHLIREIIEATAVPE